jgi:predicted Rossmann fold flavoprotein
LKIWDVVIVGAGPAGLMAGIYAGNREKAVLILEKNKTPGKKLLLSGSGQCNFTHTGDLKTFLMHYNSGASKFLKSSLYFLSNEKTMEFFEKKGVSLLIREDGKVFPKSLKAEDILNTLLETCARKSVMLENEQPVKTVFLKDGFFEIITSREKFLARKLILCTGGKSYPGTGSSGDGYALAETLGHSIAPLTPALTPVNIRDFKLAHLAGISFSEARIQLYRGGKKCSQHNGPLLITHSGLSGPGILDFSREMRAGDTLKIGFVIPENEETWKQDFFSEMRKNSRKNWKNFLSAFFTLPGRLIQTLLETSGQSPNTPCAQISKKQAYYFLENVLYYPAEIREKAGYYQAMATAGGVDLSEIRAKTLESGKVPNLFFAGEILNIDGDTGGYNIQAAFSSGALAGSKASS